ncbi:hypothetical protein ACF3DV_17965 [Chlorogloeopsis fritschii PCC 9212]|uniref:hypothetical protein n=1 Tax=Chlorogloeopsis fritschii TaxID=1124 RepID=UPI00370D9F6B
MTYGNDKQQVVEKSFLNLFDSLVSRITSRCTRPDKSYLLRGLHSKVSLLQPTQLWQLEY